MKEAFTRKSLLILGRGIGQVMFQNNALSGLLMLIGIFLNSWQMGLLAVSGNIISTLTARISGYDCDDIKNGLYGFNGTLVGIAVGVFMLLTVSSLMLMAIASCASTYIARFFNMQRMLPGFTTLFILSVWMLLGLCSWLMPDMLLVSDTETTCFFLHKLLTMFQYEYRPGDVSRKHNDRTIFPCRHSREFSECSSIYHIGGTSPPPPSHIIGSRFRSFEYRPDGI